jgi:hypothetical protein
VEAVAIVSVAGSTLVGVGGLVAAAWGGSRERRWQTREERITELRSLLEEGSEVLTQTFIVLDESTGEIRSVGELGATNAALLRELEKRLVAVSQKVGVRRGSRAGDYLALRACRDATGRIGWLLSEMQNGGNAAEHAAYSVLWGKALDAERAFLDASAKTLGWKEAVPPWRRLPRLRRSERAPSELTS